MFDNLSFFIYTRGQNPLLQDIYFIKFQVCIVIEQVYWNKKNDIKKIDKDLYPILAEEIRSFFFYQGFRFFLHRPDKRIAGFLKHQPKQHFLSLDPDILHHIQFHNIFRSTGILHFCEKIPDFFKFFLHHNI